MGASTIELLAELEALKLRAQEIAQTLEQRRDGVEVGTKVQVNFTIVAVERGGQLKFANDYEEFWYPLERLLELKSKGVITVNPLRHPEPGEVKEGDYVYARCYVDKVFEDGDITVTIDKYSSEINLVPSADCYIDGGDL